jgi:hypothetical protein
MQAGINPAPMQPAQQRGFMGGMPGWLRGRF